MQRIASRKFFRILEDHQLKALIPCFTETATQKLPICYQVSGSKVFTSSSNANYSPNAIQSKIDGANNLKEPNHGGADSENRKKHSLYMLCQTFGLSEDETKDLLTSHPFLKKELLHESASYLPRIGLEKTTFLRCPWLVTMLPGMYV